MAGRVRDVNVGLRQFPSGSTTRGPAGVLSSPVVSNVPCRPPLSRSPCPIIGFPFGHFRDISTRGLHLPYVPAMTRTITNVLTAFLFAFSAAQTAPAPQGGAPKPDNSAVNQRDKKPGEPTADSQKMNAADRSLTAKIRKAVMADKSLSTYAHNVKIISQDGTVTLKGPVRSEEEVKSVMSKAVDVAGGPDKVVNELSVKTSSSPKK